MSHHEKAPTETGCPAARSFGERFDPFGAHLEDPYPFLAEARCQEPVFYSPALGYTCVTRYDDIIRVVSDPETFPSHESLPVMQGLPEETQRGLEYWRNHRPLVTMDGERHIRLRRIIKKAFTPAAVAAMEPVIRDVAAGLLIDLEGRDQFDLVHEFSYPLTLTVILRLVGLPTSDLDRHLNWTRQEESIRFMSDDTPVAFIEECVRGVTDWMSYLHAAINDRIDRPRDDFLSSMVRADIGGYRPTPDDVAGMLPGLIIAGYYTTAHGLANIVHAQLANPGRWQSIADKDNDLAGLIEEGLRFDTSVMGLCRTTSRAVDVSGINLPEGARLAVLFGSGNHDETRFSLPESFCPGQHKESQHLVFGYGRHFCPGATSGPPGTPRGSRDVGREISRPTVDCQSEHRSRPTFSDAGLSFAPGRARHRRKGIR